MDRVLQVMDIFAVYVQHGEQGATNVDLQCVGDHRQCRASFFGILR